MNATFILRVAAGVCLLSIQLALSGCMATVTSKGATTSDGGIRYYLPQPFVKVVPSTDGTIAVDLIYLPDPDNAYTVTSSSALGKYTLDIKRTEEGFLDTVTFNSDNTGVAKQVI